MHMPIQENALNGMLSDVLKGIGLHATPEMTREKNQGKRCDVEVRFKKGDAFYVAVECKIGTTRSHEKKVTVDARRWLSDYDCLGAVALCYPSEISRDSTDELSKVIRDSSTLRMSVACKDGNQRWDEGGVRDLARMCRETLSLGKDNSYLVTRILKRAILGASGYVSPVLGKELAEKVLELPWHPESGRRTDPRPALIACLILSNMILLQNRLVASSVQIKGLRTLEKIKIEKQLQACLREDWQKIRKKDYAPVVDPAIEILRTLPTGRHTESLLRTLIESVMKCATMIQGLQLDHAGPLYHGLLQTARYDGSFYTSNAAATLLSELAIPDSWNSVCAWNDPEQLTRLKICDPACGTGTLLMASAKTIGERFYAHSEDLSDVDILHLGLIEDVLHGMDINRHAIHLSASMLTIMAPEIDYNKINLYNMWHGEDNRQETRAGSLELLTGDEVSIPGFTPSPTYRKASAEGYEENRIPDLSGQCDLVIMNPPYTRNDIRNSWLGKDMKKKVQGREKSIHLSITDNDRKKCIDRVSVGTFFPAIADKLIKDDTGTFASVMPFSACMAPSSRGVRNLLEKRFHVEVVVTSHDPDRIFFSENTGIHESLIIARRQKSAGRHTAFVSLINNPATSHDAHILSDAIQKALSGDVSSLSSFGTITWRNIEKNGGGAWNATCFYDQTLAKTCDLLLEVGALVPLGKNGENDACPVGPSGRSTRQCFEKSSVRQIPDRRVLWDNKSGKQMCMKTKPESYLVAKRDHLSEASNLWEKRAHLLIPERMRLNLASATALYSDQKILGSAFSPVRPVLHKGVDPSEVSKAWCAWLNSTMGILSFMNIARKNLTYSWFASEYLKMLPVPHPEKCDIERLARTFDKYCDKSLYPIPEICKDRVRHKIDEEAIQSVPSLPWDSFDCIREKISKEPRVLGPKGKHLVTGPPRA